MNEGEDATLQAAWERFCEEEKLSEDEAGRSRRAFFAGAQSFAAFMSAVLVDVEDEAESERMFVVLLDQLQAAIEEMKL